MTSERQARNTHPAANLAGQSEMRFVQSGDGKGSDKAVSNDTSEIPPSLQAFDKDGDDALSDDASPDEPYSSPLET